MAFYPVHFSPRFPARGRGTMIGVGGTNVGVEDRVRGVKTSGTSNPGFRGPRPRATLKLTATAPFCFSSTCCCNQQQSTRPRRRRFTLFPMLLLLSLLTRTFSLSPSSSLIHPYNLQHPPTFISNQSIPIRHSSASTELNQ